MEQPQPPTPIPFHAPKDIKYLPKLTLVFPFEFFILIELFNVNCCANTNTNQTLGLRN